jgi:hypothetical protein
MISLKNNRREAQLMSAPQQSPPEQEAAIYVHDLVGELARISNAHGFKSLTLLLEMAGLEAQEMAWQSISAIIAASDLDLHEPQPTHSQA